jgi:hypothetical protein
VDSPTSSAARHVEHLRDAALFGFTGAAVGQQFRDRERVYRRSHRRQSDGEECERTRQVGVADPRREQPSRKVTEDAAVDAGAVPCQKRHGRQQCPGDGRHQCGLDGQPVVTRQSLAVDDVANTERETQHREHTPHDDPHVSHQRQRQQ